MQTPTEATREEVLALYSRTGPRLIGLLIAIGGSRSDAHEVVQEAYLELRGQWSKVSTRFEPESWVRVIAVRLLISRHRRAEAATFGLRRLAGRAQQHSPDAITDALPLTAALGSLPVSQRAVLILHEVLDLPLEQVAQELQIPVGKVRLRLVGARAALDQLLSETKATNHA